MPDLKPFVLALIFLALVHIDLDLTNISSKFANDPRNSSFTGCVIYEESYGFREWSKECKFINDKAEEVTAEEHLADLRDKYKHPMVLVDEYLRMRLP